MKRTKRTGTEGRRAAAAAAALLALLAATAATAADGPGFLRTEREVTGAAASGDWRARLGLETGAVAQIGDQGLDKQQPLEIGGSGPAKEGEGPSVSGDKVKAGALSLVLPGAGQFYNGDRSKAYVMAGIEVGIWTAYFVFDAQGDNRRDAADQYAGVYAGTSGSHPDAYWQAVGRYLDSDAYEDYLRREARATGENPPADLPASDRWQWVNADRKYDYQKLRADASAAYDRRDFMILFAVVNRAVAVVDAVIGAGKTPGTVEAEVLGLNVSMGVVPSWHDPGARCAVSRSF